jgi:hypothetical protein
MPVNKFGDSGNHSAIFTIHASSSIGLTLPQRNNIFLRRNGANNATCDLNMSGRRVLNIPTPTERQDDANKSYADETTVIKTGDVIGGNLILKTGNNPSFTLGCNNLLSNKRFSLISGTTSNMIHNQVGQPVTLQATDGILLRIGDCDIAKFKTSNIIFHRDKCHISNLRDPDSDNDAVNKKYIDSLMKASAPNITSTPTMTNNSTTINGLTCVTVASSMAVGQNRAWRAFTNEVVTPGSPASTFGWVPSAKDVAPWIQLHYASSIVFTSFNIFVCNVPGRNITSWNVQGGNNPVGSEFSTLLASTTQLNANKNYSFNIDNSTAYKVYRFNILARTGGSGSGSGGAEIGISLLQFRTSKITANGYAPMAANLNMNRI